MIKMPREDGAWWMSLTCWICGWAATLRWTWEPLLPAGIFLCGFVGAQALRTSVRIWEHDRPSARRLVGVLAAVLAAASALGVLLVTRLEESLWLVPAAVPGLAYAGVILLQKERRVAGRMLAIVALTSIAPLAYASVVGSFDRVAAILWAALGAYYFLGGLFVMARLRKSRTALWVVRLLAPAVSAAVLLMSIHWLLSAAFFLLTARAWAYRPAAIPLDPRRVGWREVAYGTVSSAAILVALWLK